MATPVAKIIPPAPAEPVRSEADMETHVLIYKSRVGGAVCRGFTGPRYIVQGAVKTLLSSNRVVTIEDERVMSAKDFPFTPGELEVCDLIGSMPEAKANKLNIP